MALSLLSSEGGGVPGTTSKRGAWPDENIGRERLVANSLIVDLGLLVAGPGYTQSKPVESQPPTARSQPHTSQTPAKGIQRIESKEELGHWKGSQLIGAKVEDPSRKNIGKKTWWWTPRGASSSPCCHSVDSWGSERSGMRSPGTRSTSSGPPTART